MISRYKANGCYKQNLWGCDSALSTRLLYAISRIRCCKSGKISSHELWKCCNGANNDNVGIDMIPVLLSWPCPTYPTCVCHVWPCRIILVSIIGPVKSKQQHTMERVKALHWKKWWSGGPFDVLCSSFYTPPMSSALSGLRLCLIIIHCMAGREMAWLL